MEPVFVIDTTVSEENYRKGLKAALSYSFPWLILVLCSVYYLVDSVHDMYWFVYWYFTYDYLDKKQTILCAAFILAFIYILYLLLTANRKRIDRSIQNLMINTGVTYLHHEISFMEQEMLFNNIVKNEEIHIPYSYIYKIKKTDDMLILQIKPESAVYMMLSDISDFPALRTFLLYKCPRVKGNL